VAIEAAASSRSCGRPNDTDIILINKSAPFEEPIKYRAAHVRDPPATSVLAQRDERGRGASVETSPLPLEWKLSTT